MNHANFAETTLAAAITDTGGTSITVTSEAGFPAVQFIISIDTEAMLVTNVATTTWTVTRGYEGSTAATHLNGAAIFHDISAAEADAIATKLPLAGGTLVGPLIMDNMDVTLVKLLTLHGEIDDSAGASVINWNSGAAHKITLTGNVTFAFSGGNALCAIPIMTSNTSPSGVASADSFGGTYYAWHALDNINASFSDDWISGYSALPHWLQYQFVSGQIALTYAITSLHSGYAGDDMPKDWKLQGSNNGTDWTDLDVVTGGFTTGQFNIRKSYTIDNPASYTYYQLLVSAVVTGASPDYCGISRFELATEGVPTDPAAPCFLTLKLVQDATGGRTVTWPATVKGTPHINSAANAVSIVYLYWDGTNYYVVNEAGAAGAGTGDVVGPVSATPGNMATYADDTGKVVQDGGAIPTTLPASDVSAWAKAATKPAYASSEIGNISAAGQALIDDANAAAQLVTLGTAAYSEGTWTPNLLGFTIVGSAPATTGVWKRIGNLIFIICTIAAGAGGNTSVASNISTAYCNNLPVSASVASACFIEAFDGVALGTTIVSGSNMSSSTYAAQTHNIYYSATYAA